MFLKKYLLWILLFGSLIGLSETLIASFSMPYRSVILSSITILLLSIARIQIPKFGTSFLIIAIAILFKINNFGVYSCSPNFLLCGPTAMLMLGISYEVFASLFIKKDSLKYLNLILTCGITAIVTFSIFALMNTFILKTWDTTRFTEYILIKSTLTAILSGTVSMLALYLKKTFQSESSPKLSHYVINSVLGIVVVILWVFGSLTKF
jgi:hypothetical protein